MKKADLTGYLNEIAKLPVKKEGRYSRQELLTKQFLLDQNERLQIYFAPHNLYVQRQARIMIVGICPGWTQTELAFHTYRDNLNLDMKQRLLRCKRASRFAGGMRRNLVEMLDQLGVHECLGLASSAELFADQDFLLHTTSLIKFPIFKAGKNYSGSGPKILKDQLLTDYVRTYFLEEVREFDHPLLMIPLGKAVEEVLLKLREHGELDRCQIATGFPHPSGVNGHRKEQFATNFGSLKKEIHDFCYNRQITGN